SKSAFFRANYALKKLCVSWTKRFTLLIEKKLNLSYVRNVVFRLIVDDLDFVTFTDDLSDLFQCYVAALESVVKLAVLVTLDDTYVFHVVALICGYTLLNRF